MKRVGSGGKQEGKKMRRSRKEGIKFITLKVGRKQMGGS
jgi:hypothetical protein